MLDRFPGENGERKRPDYLVVYGDKQEDIDELTKKHAAYFGVPIMLIDPKKYGRKTKEVR